MRWHKYSGIGVVLAIAFCTLAALSRQSALAQKDRGSLPLCGKCFSPSVFATSGIGTAQAKAEARVTYQDAKDYCEQWSMEEHPDCGKEAKETLREENGKVYIASADCVHGRMTIADGENFIYAGLWPTSDRYLAGQTQWRWGPGSFEDTGKIVGWDGPTRAPMVAATAKLLCPNGIGAAPANAQR